MFYRGNKVWVRDGNIDLRRLEKTDNHCCLLVTNLLGFRDSAIKIPNFKTNG